MRARSTALACMSARRARSILFALDVEGAEPVTGHAGAPRGIPALDMQPAPPITCATFRRRLGDYVERVLAHAQVLGMDAHARRCRGCGRVLDEYLAVASIARKATDASMPAEARANLRRLVAHATRRRS